MSLSLREYQQQGVNQIRANFARGDKVVCYQAPTGAGKTRVFSYITYHASQRGNGVWLIVHRKELLRQAHDSLSGLNVDHGLISPLFTPNPMLSTQVASIDTLKNRYMKYAPPPLIICDEGHHSVSPTWHKILSHFISLGSKVLMVTATPNRLDGRGLGKESGGLCDSLIMGPQPQELIKQGFLAKPMIYRPILATTEGLHTKFGEYKQDERSDMMDKPKIIGDAVKSYSQICPNKPTIVFVPSLKMADHVQTQYRAAGYQAAMVDGSMPDIDRKRRLLDLGNGGLHLLISCSLIDEGVDVPIVEGIQLLDPTKSVARFLQRTGRGARMFPGKQGYYLLDHVCNTFFPNMEINHGDPSWDREWSLEGEVKKKAKPQEAGPSFNQCPSCYGISTKSPRCPYCGFTYEVNGRVIEQEEGRLEQLDPATIQRLQKIEEDRSRWARLNEERSCKTYQDFAALAAKRGYAQSWAGIRWAQKKKRNASTLPGI